MIAYQYLKMKKEPVLELQEVHYTEVMTSHFTIWPLILQIWTPNFQALIALTHV